MNVDLGFGVGGAAAEKITVADGRFERRRSPKIERLRRLHVIMTVKKDGGLSGGFERFGIDERMKICRKNFDFLEARRAKMICDPTGGTLDVGLVFSFGTNAGDSQKFAKL